MPVRSTVFACHSTDPLTEHPDTTSSVLLTGERRFRGNSALRIFWIADRSLNVRSYKSRLPTPGRYIGRELNGTEVTRARSSSTELCTPQDD